LRIVASASAILKTRMIVVRRPDVMCAKARAVGSATPSPPPSDERTPALLPTARFLMADIDLKERITATIEDFTKLSGISRSRVYELLKAGELESVHIMGRHLIIVQSYHDYLLKLRKK
jgi:hypothetical protein